MSPWWYSAEPDSLQVPQSRKVDPMIWVVLAVCGFLCFENLWSLYKHFAGIERRETVKVVFDLLGFLGWGSVMVVAWRRGVSPARNVRGGEPPPPVSNP